MQISTVTDTVSPANGSNAYSQIHTNRTATSYTQHENMDIYYHEHDGDRSVLLSLNRQMNTMNSQTLRHFIIGVKRRS